MMHRSKIFLSLFFIPLMSLGLGLGIWQYQRSIWKENLLESYHIQLSQAPNLLPTLIIRLRGDKTTVVGHNNQLLKAFELMPLTITGHFLPHLVFYRPVHDGIELITAFETDDGIIAVNAGVMAHQSKDLPIDNILPTKEITLNGFYRIPENYGDKLPINRSLVAKIPFLSFYNLYKRKTLIGAIQVNDTINISQYLKGRSGDYFIKNIPNNHIQYMGTWFLLTGVAVVIYIMLLQTNRLKK